MQTLPRALRRYLCVVWAVALAITCVCYFLYPLPRQELLDVAVFAVLATIAITKPIQYSRSYAQTVETAILIAAAFTLSPGSVLLVVIVAFVIFGIHKKFPLHKAAFNVAFGIILFGSIPLVINAFGLQDAILGATMNGALAVAVIFVGYTVLSTSLMAIVVALANEQPVRSVWRETLKFFNAYDLALLPYGLILAWLWRVGPWLFAVGLLPLAALQRSFAHHAALLREQRHTAELVEQQRRVHEAMTVVLSGKTMHEQLDTLLAHIGAVFPVERAGVVLWGENSQSDAIVTRGDAQLEHVLRSWRTDLLQLRDMSQMLRLDHARSACRVDDLPVWLVPLATPSRALGSLVLVGTRMGELSPQQQQLMETFAGQAALAISQSRLIVRLQDVRQQLIESERLAAIGGLAAGVAHEFNNLLSVLSGTVQVAMMDETDPEERQQLLHMVAQMALNGTSITDGLLRFGRREAPRRETTRLDALIDAVLTAIRNDCAHNNVAVVRDLDPVPTVVCEAGAISQVLINLVYNALDAIAPNPGTLTVRLKQHGEYVTFAVEDTGCGIAPDVIHTIFEPFMTTKADRRTTLHGGTGLGLSVSHGIIANHGGSIDVQSELGKGTTFTVHLPINSPGTAAADAPLVALGVSPLRAVVVDDEPAIAQALGRMLSRDGHTATWFTEPQAAIAAMQREPVDVVFADLRMPGMDGLTLLDWVKQQELATACVLISAHLDAQHRQQACAQGIKAVIEKPFDCADIQRVLGGLLPNAA